MAPTRSREVFIFKGFKAMSTLLQKKRVFLVQIFQKRKLPPIFFQFWKSVGVLEAQSGTFNIRENHSDVKFKRRLIGYLSDSVIWASASWFSLRSWTQGCEIEPHMGLPALRGVCFSLPLPFPHSCACACARTHRHALSNKSIKSKGLSKSDNKWSYRNQVKKRRYENWEWRTAGINLESEASTFSHGPLYHMDAFFLCTCSFPVSQQAGFSSFFSYHISVLEVAMNFHSTESALILCEFSELCVHQHLSFFKDGGSNWLSLVSRLILFCARVLCPDHSAVVRGSKILR